MQLAAVVEDENEKEQEWRFGHVRAVAASSLYAVAGARQFIFLSGERKRVGRASWVLVSNSILTDSARPLETVDELH